MAPPRSLLALVLGLLGALACGCRDNEQRARAAGEAARAEVGRACATAGARAEPGVRGVPAEPEDAAEEVEGCAHRACEAPCREFAGTETFHRACVSACTANAECVNDTDCGAGLRCIAIAPRVRRCRATPTSHTPAPGSAP